MCLPEQQMPAPRSEAAFQEGIKATPWYSEFTRDFGEEPNLNAPEYNYRKAWAAGVRPERDPYDVPVEQHLMSQVSGLPAQGRYHWSSIGKSNDHPTAWKEKFMQLFGDNPDAHNLAGPTEASRFLLKR